MTGIGSSVADVFYACVGVFGITIISDFLLKHQSIICMEGCVLVIIIGIQTFQKRGETSLSSLRQPATPEDTRQNSPGALRLVFFSPYVIVITNPATILSFMVVFSMFQIGGNESMGENIQMVSI